MKKLTLQLEDLDATAFEVSAPADELVANGQGAAVLPPYTYYINWTCDSRCL
jgi:hypothetical protein